MAGQLADRDVTEEPKRRIQIREVIRAHLDKERELFAQGIKVLSLFFIDEVAKYRDYEPRGHARRLRPRLRGGVPGAGGRRLGQLDFDAEAAAYRTHVEGIAVRDTHQGYFSIDKKTKRQVDGRGREDRR